MDAGCFLTRRLRHALLGPVALALGCSHPPLTSTDLKPGSDVMRNGAPSHAGLMAQRNAEAEYTSDSSTVARPQAPSEPDAIRRYPAPVIPVGSPAPAPVVPADGSATGSPAIFPTAALTSPPASADTQLRVVAAIGTDVVITDDEVWQMVRQRAGEYVKLTGLQRETKETQLFEESLRSLIDRELILADFVAKLKKNKPELIDKLQSEARQSAEKELKRFRKLNNISDEAEFAQVLRGQGMSLKGLQRQIERKAMVDIYLGQLLKDKKATVTLAQVYQYYRTHPDEFRVDDTCEWLDLFVVSRRFETPAAAQSYAEDLRRQAVSGADFVELVKKHGHGDSVLRGGEGVGTKRGEIQPRELEPTVFALSDGEVSGLIPTETGYHIVKVVKRTAAGVRPFDETVQLEIRGKLAKDVAQTEYKRVIEDLWRKTTVRLVNQPGKP